MSTSVKPSTAERRERMRQARQARRDEAAARREDRNGSGPTLEVRPPLRFPGAAAKFALLGEVLLVGLLVALVSVPVLTLPAALVAGVRHLRRYVRAEGSPLRAFWRDVRAALAGGVAVGAAAVVLVMLLTLDLAIAGAEALPGAPLMMAFGVLGLIAVGVVLLSAVGVWTPERGWRGALRAVPGAIAADVAGACYLAATTVFVAVATWALIPLIVPALGCAALAVVAIPERPRRR